MAGIIAGGAYGRQQPAPPPTGLPTPTNALANQYKLYNSGVAQNAEDYGGIMQGYKNLAQSAAGRVTPQVQSGGYTPTMVTPQTLSTPSTYDYKPTADATASIGNLKQLSQTGGYSGEDIANLRARGISPIRSVYANAQREIGRNRSLQGGFSPNYNATQAKMTRELSEQIANQVTNVNAGIAQNVAQNKIGVSGQYNQAAQHEGDLINQFGKANSDTINDTNKTNAGIVNNANQFNAGNANQASQFNITNPQDAARITEALKSGNMNTILQALEGQKSLYGTTPALSNLFGNQAMQGAQFNNQVSQQAQQPGMQIISQLMSGLR